MSFAGWPWRAQGLCVLSGRPSTLVRAGTSARPPCRLMPVAVAVAGLSQAGAQTLGPKPVASSPRRALGGLGETSWAETLRGPEHLLHLQHDRDRPQPTSLERSTVYHVPWLGATSLQSRPPWSRGLLPGEPPLGLCADFAFCPGVAPTVTRPARRDLIPMCCVFVVRVFTSAKTLFPDEAPSQVLGDRTGHILWGHNIQKPGVPLVPAE